MLEKSEKTIIQTIKRNKKYFDDKDNNKIDKEKHIRKKYFHYQKNAQETQHQSYGDSSFDENPVGNEF